jgi:hypothetical protein
MYSYIIPCLSRQPQPYNLDSVIRFPIVPLTVYRGGPKCRIWRALSSRCRPPDSGQQGPTVSLRVDGTVLG